MREIAGKDYRSRAVGQLGCGSVNVRTGLIPMIEYTGILDRVGFNIGTYGPWAVTIYCHDVTPTIPDEDAGFQLNNAEKYTFNGIAVTLRELVIDLCGQFEPKGVRVRIVWDEHRYGNVREAHFTTEAKT